jgi:hypothetical protein
MGFSTFTTGSGVGATGSSFFMIRQIKSSATAATMTPPITRVFFIFSSFLSYCFAETLTAL